MFLRTPPNLDLTMIFTATVYSRLLYRMAAIVTCCICTTMAVYAQGPIAHWPLDGNAVDASGSGHDGEINGATPTADRFGRAGSAFQFDGNDFIMVPHSPELTFRTDQDFTISAWIRTCLIQDDYAGIVAKGSNTTSRSGYQLLIRNGSQVALEISRNDGNYTTLYGRSSVIDPRWHFVTLVVSSPLGIARIYVDGVLDASASYGVNSLAPDLRETQRPLFIGTERNSSVFFNGAIDDVRIYDRMLSEGEILDLYHQNGWSDENGAKGLTTITACPGSPVLLTARDLRPPYLWSNGATSHSITVRQAGRYLVRANLGLGCPRVDTFDVVDGVGLDVDAGDTARICGNGAAQLEGTVGGSAGNYTYRWSPAEGLSSATSASTTASPKRTITYYLSVTDAGGCSGLDSVTVVVDSIPAGRAGADMEICEGAQVQLGRNPAPTDTFTYRWISGEGLTLTDIPRPLVRPTASGAYVLEMRSRSGCSLLDTILVTVRSAPQVDAGPDRRACIGEPVRIGSKATGGTGPYTYRWAPITGLSSPTDATPLASFVGSTTYTVTVTDANGCTGVDTVHVLIGALPLGLAGADITTCADQEVRIGAEPPAGTNYTYRWISGEGLLSTDVARPLVRPSSSGQYVVEISNGAGCAALDTVAVMVLSAPRVEAGPDRQICIGESVRIGSDASGGNGPYSYLWSPATGLSSITEAMPLASPVGSARYVVTVTDAKGCSSADTVMVTMNPVLAGAAGTDMMICPGEEAQLGIDPPSGSGYTYSWISGEGLGATNIARPRVRPSASGEYVLRIRNTDGCEALDTVNVEVSIPPVVDAGPDRNLCNDDRITIGSDATGGVGPYSYLWSPASGLSSSTVAMPVAAPTVATRYTVIVTDARGCRDTSSVLVVPALTTVELAEPLQGGRLLFDHDLDHEAGGAVCDSITLRNLSDLPRQIDLVSLAKSSYFSISAGQVPFVIPPRSERRLAVCYMPHSFFDETDTLLLGVDCGISIPLFLRANVHSVDQCNSAIGFRMLQKRTHFRAEPPYPNPARDGITLLVERASASLESVPAGECRLYSSDGIEVATGTYLPQSGWSRDGMSYERGAFEITTGDLPSGIYHVRIRRGEEIISHPVVISR